MDGWMGRRMDREMMGGGLWMVGEMNEKAE